MQKFCKKCGNPLDENGKCINCDKEFFTKKQLRKSKREAAKAEKKAAKKERWKKLPFGQKVKKLSLRFLIAALVFMLIFGSGTATLVYFDVVDIPAIEKVFGFFGIKKGEDNAATKNNDKTADGMIYDSVPEDKRYKVAPPDVEEYYNNNSQVISKTKAEQSDLLQTEAEVYTYLTERGFGNNPITTTYAIDGTYYDEKEIKNDSAEKHPIYTTHYITENNSVWTISVINGSIIANPISYSLDADLDIPLILSENNAVMSYDSEANVFYETIPNNTEMTLKEVEKIDSATLESLSNGGLDTL